MSLKNIRNGFDKIREKGEEYFNLEKEKNEIENDINVLKSKYREEGVNRNVLSDRNKKLISIQNNMGAIRKEIEKISQKIDQEIRKEIQYAV
ncbi:hypothetical protein J4442_00075 [Candidatus Woesearchaeota archaeon]|nr:hypothetical protein [Candidatus Woesearchaeota archaeon]